MLATISSRASGSMDVKPVAVGVAGAVALVATCNLMGSDFTLGAYASSGVALAVAASYIPRLLKTEVEEEEYITTIDDREVKLPTRLGGPMGGWPKEYTAFCLAGCIFGILSFLEAAFYIEGGPEKAVAAQAAAEAVVGMPDTALTKAVLMSEF